MLSPAFTNRLLPALFLLISLPLATPLLGAEPVRIMVVGDSISVGYTDNPNWNVPFQFGFRSGLYSLLTNAGIAFQFVGNSPEPWDGKYGVSSNVPPLDLRTIGQDRCAGYGGRRVDFIAANIVSWMALNS